MPSAVNAGSSRHGPQCNSPHRLRRERPKVLERAQPICRSPFRRRSRFQRRESLHRRRTPTRRTRQTRPPSNHYHSSMRRAWQTCPIGVSTASTASISYRTSARHATAPTTSIVGMSSADVSNGPVPNGGFGGSQQALDRFTGRRPPIGAHALWQPSDAFPTNREDLGGSTSHES